MRLTRPSGFRIVALAAVLAQSTLAPGCEPEQSSQSAAPVLRAEAALNAPRIRIVSVSGDGCPDASEFTLTAERDSFSSELTGYVVAVSPGAAEAHAHCAVTLGLDASEDVAYAPAGLEVEFSTDSTSKVTLSTEAAWSGNPDVASRTRSRIRSRGWRSTHTVLDDEALWSPCNGTRELQLRTALDLTPAKGRAGYASVLSLSNLRFRAKRCGTGSPDAGSVPDGGAPSVPDGGPTSPEDGGATAPDASTAPGAPEVKITKVDFIGTLCPTDRTTVQISDDGKSFELHTPGADVQDPEGAGFLAHCGLIVNVDAPPGYRTVLESVVVDGNVQLTGGATVVLSSEYWFPPPSRHKESTYRLSEANNGPFSQTMDFGASPILANFCTATFTTAIDLIAPGGPGSSANVSLRRVHSWKLRLVRC